MIAPKRNYKAWLAKDKNDLLNIENNLAATHVPWDTVSFHAQQAAEKHLKVFWFTTPNHWQGRMIWLPYWQGARKSTPVWQDWNRSPGTDLPCGHFALSH